MEYTPETYPLGRYPTGREQIITITNGLHLSTRGRTINIEEKAERQQKRIYTKDLPDYIYVNMNERHYEIWLNTKNNSILEELRTKTIKELSQHAKIIG